MELGYIVRRAFYLLPHGIVLLAILSFFLTHSAFASSQNPTRAKLQSVYPASISTSSHATDDTPPALKSCASQNIVPADYGNPNDDSSDQKKWDNNLYSTSIGDQTKIPQGMSEGRWGEILLHNNEGLDGHAIDTVYWIIIQYAYDPQASIYNSQATTNNCVVNFIQNFFQGLTFTIAIITMLIAGISIVIGQTQNQFRGIRPLIFPVLIGLAGPLLVPFIVSQVLSLNNALIQFFGEQINITPSQLFDYVGNEGKFYYMSIAGQNSYSPGNFWGFMTSIGFLIMVVSSFLLEIFVSRIVFLDILLAISPLAVLGFVIPQARRWSELWISSFVTTAVMQTFILLFLLVGGSLQNNNFLNSTNNVLGTNFYDACVFLLALRIPNVLRSLYNQREQAIQSKNISDVQRQFDNWYTYHEDPVLQFRAYEQKVRYVSQWVGIAKDVVDVADYGIDLSKNIKSIKTARSKTNTALRDAEDGADKSDIIAEATGAGVAGKEFQTAAEAEKKYNEARQALADATPQIREAAQKQVRAAEATYAKALEEARTAYNREMRNSVFAGTLQGTFVATSIGAAIAANPDPHHEGWDDSTGFAAAPIVGAVVGGVAAYGLAASTRMSSSQRRLLSEARIRRRR
jgi:type IV secretory pathway VirB2 component (pilin)